MLVNYWVSLFLMVSAWILTLIINGISNEFLFYSFFFFLSYFSLPLIHGKWRILLLCLLPLPLFALSVSLSQSLFIDLLLIVLTLQVIHNFDLQQAISYTMYTFGLLILAIIMTQEWLVLLFLIFAFILTVDLIQHYFNLTTQYNVNKANLTQLQDDYNHLKREQVENLDTVRQEERNRIAREIHDSVGHRLTALAMQLEVERLQSNDETMTVKFAELKNLAQSSLDDTRQAVKTLQSDEVIGIQAIIQLIRKLELESRLDLTLTIQTGVFGVSLSNVQSVAIYRMLQEALTNMMKHSHSRQAEIKFKLIANRDLRFQVDHATHQPVKITEGFGLKNLRARLNELDGQLTIEQTNTKLSVIGQLPLEGYQDE